jgi:hypothetical protein
VIALFIFCVITETDPNFLDVAVWHTQYLRIKIKRKVIVKLLNATPLILRLVATRLLPSERFSRNILRDPDGI